MSRCSPLPTHITPGTLVSPPRWRRRIRAIRVTVRSGSLNGERRGGPRFALSIDRLPSQEDPHAATPGLAVRWPASCSARSATAGTRPNQPPRVSPHRAVVHRDRNRNRVRCPWSIRRSTDAHDRPARAQVRQLRSRWVVECSTSAWVGSSTDATSGPTVHNTRCRAMLTPSAATTPAR